MIVAPRSPGEMQLGKSSRDSAQHIAMGGEAGRRRSPTEQGLGVADTKRPEASATPMRGSGADIAAAVHGGAILFEAAAGSGAMITRTTWPAGLRMIPFYTGESADTADLIARVMTARLANPAPVDAALSAI